MPHQPPDLAAVIGHRGAAAMAPENTLAGLRAAHAAGAAWVEVDLRSSADGRAVLFHDATLERTTDGRGRVADHRLDDLQRLDAGRWFDPAFAGEPVPDLGSALRLAGSRGLGVNLELKAEPGAAGDLGEALAADLRAAGPRPPLLLTSFDRTALETCARRLPDVPRGLLADDLPDDWREAARALGCVSVHLGYGLLDADRIAAIHAADLRVVAWTLNDLKWAHRLWEWGVDSIVTDDPALLLAERRHAG